MTEESIDNSQRVCGGFFFFLAVLGQVLLVVNSASGEWGATWSLLPGTLFCWFLGWWAFGARVPAEPPAASAPGTSEAGKPVPVHPSPTHHLVAAKETPPSDKTHSWPVD